MRAFRWPLAAVGAIAFILFVTWLRHRAFSADPILFSYLQMVGSLLGFTFAANAMVRFRGTHDRLTLILAFGFVLAALIETITIFGFYSMLSGGLPMQPHIPLAWMVSRTLLAVLILAALTVEKRLPSSRDPSREIFVALAVVGIVAYLTSAAFLSYPVEPSIHPLARIARPWDLLPALLFLVAAVACRRRLHRDRTAFDYALCAACWLNVACHVAASQSERLLDGPFTLAQILKVSSYAVVLGGALLDNARLFDQVQHLAVTDSLTGLGNYRTLVQTLEAEIQRSRRTGRPFALLLFDLDALKSVNDRYGHLVGSSAIRRLAAKMRTSCRTMDTAALWRRRICRGAAGSGHQRRGHRRTPHLRAPGAGRRNAAHHVQRRRGRLPARWREYRAVVQRRRRGAVPHEGAWRRRRQQFGAHRCVPLSQSLKVLKRGPLGSTV